MTGLTPAGEGGTVPAPPPKSAVMADSVLIPHPLEAMPADLAGGVVVIGNFDGVHRGHGILLDAAVKEAHRRGTPAVVLTFEPHPRTFFRPTEPVFRLSPLPAKARLLTAFGLDGLVVANFDRAFASLSPDAFAETVLAARLRAVAAVVGHDFRYGRGRAGTAETLAGEGNRLGFPVTVISEVVDEAGAPVSSSGIRAALAEGRVGEAARRLGHRWFVQGEVIRGEQRGRELGFPTANLRLSPETGLRHGVYAVTFQHGAATYGGVASYGRRPTFDNGAPLLETFVFDFSGDLYGATVAVSFLEWIRPELRFESAAALIAEMTADAEKAKAIVKAAGAGTAIDRRLAAIATPVVAG